MLNYPGYNPAISVESVQPAEGNRFRYRFVCHPGGPVVLLDTHVPPKHDLIDGAPLPVWRQLRDRLFGWYNYAQDKCESTQDEHRDQAGFL